MNPRNRLTRPEPDTLWCELYFVKQGHRYAFRYPRGDAGSLVQALLDAALHPQLNLDLGDARRIIETLGLPAIPLSLN